MSAWLTREAEERVKFFPQRRDGVDALLRQIARNLLADRTAAAASIDRESLGREVRLEWVEWATEQDDPKPSWLVPWEGLSEPDREVDRRIGERLHRMGITAAAEQLAAIHDAVFDCPHGPTHHYAIDGACSRCEMPSWIVALVCAALGDATALADRDELAKCPGTDLPCAREQEWGHPCDRDEHWVYEREANPTPNVDRRGPHYPTTPVQCSCGWRETDADAGTWTAHLSREDFYQGKVERNREIAAEFCTERDEAQAEVERLRELVLETRQQIAALRNDNYGNRTFERGSDAVLIDRLDTALDTP